MTGIINFSKKHILVILSSTVSVEPEDSARAQKGGRETTLKEALRRAAELRALRPLGRVSVPTGQNARGEGGWEGRDLVPAECRWGWQRETHCLDA